MKSHFTCEGTDLKGQKESVAVLGLLALGLGALPLHLLHPLVWPSFLICREMLARKISTLIGSHQPFSLSR